MMILGEGGGAVYNRPALKRISKMTELLFLATTLGNIILSERNLVGREEFAKLKRDRTSWQR